MAVGDRASGQCRDESCQGHWRGPPITLYSVLRIATSIGSSFSHQALCKLAPPEGLLRK